MQGQGVTDRTPFPVGCHNGNHTQLAQGLGQCQNAGGVDTVVVRNHDVHVMNPVPNDVTSRPVMAEFDQEIKPRLPPYFVFTKKGELGTFIPQTWF
jgi:hypothetical protein